MVYILIIKAREALKQWKSKLKEKRNLQREELRNKQKPRKKDSTNKDEDKTIPIDQVVTLEHLTNPEKNNKNE